MKPKHPDSKIGNEVIFSPPEDVNGGSKIKRRIIDELWTDLYYDKRWGWYVYTSQLIQWKDESRSIRMTYYYYRESDGRWVFGQFSVEDSPEIIQQFIQDTLAKCRQ